MRMFKCILANHSVQAHTTGTASTHDIFMDGGYEVRSALRDDAASVFGLCGAILPHMRRFADSFRCSAAMCCNVAHLQHIAASRHTHNELWRFIWVCLTSIFSLFVYTLTCGHLSQTQSLAYVHTYSHAPTHWHTHTHIPLPMPLVVAAGSHTRARTPEIHVVVDFVVVVQSTCAR